MGADQKLQEPRPFPLLVRGLVGVPGLAPRSYLDTGSLGHLQAVRLTWIPSGRRRRKERPSWPAEGTKEPGGGRSPEEGLHTTLSWEAPAPTHPRKLPELQWRETASPLQAGSHQAGQEPRGGSVPGGSSWDGSCQVTQPRNTFYLDQPSSKHTPAWG